MLIFYVKNPKNSIFFDILNISVRILIYFWSVSHVPSYTTCWQVVASLGSLNVFVTFWLLLLLVIN